MCSGCPGCDSAQILDSKFWINLDMDIESEQDLIKVFNSYIHQDAEIQLATANIKQKQTEFTQKFADFTVLNHAISAPVKTARRSPHELEAIFKTTQSINNLVKSILSSAVVIEMRRDFIASELGDWIEKSRHAAIFPENSSHAILKAVNDKYRLGDNHPVWVSLKTLQVIENFFADLKNDTKIDAQLTTLENLTSEVAQYAEDFELEEDFKNALHALKTIKTFAEARLSTTLPNQDAHEQASNQATKEKEQQQAQPQQPAA